MGYTPFKSGHVTLLRNTLNLTAEAKNLKELLNVGKSLC